jgi:hypothetical protein
MADHHDDVPAPDGLAPRMPEGVAAAAVGIAKKDRVSRVPKPKVGAPVAPDRALVGGASLVATCDCGCELRVAKVTPKDLCPTLAARVDQTINTFPKPSGTYADVFKVVVVPGSQPVARCPSCLWVCDLCWRAGSVYIVKGPGGQNSSLTSVTVHTRKCHAGVLATKMDEAPGASLGGTGTEVMVVEKGKSTLTIT